jgi:hypothetical protein
MGVTFQVRSLSGVRSTPRAKTGLLSHSLIMTLIFGCPQMYLDSDSSVDRGRIKEILHTQGIPRYSRIYLWSTLGIINLRCYVYCVRSSSVSIWRTEYSAGQNRLVVSFSNNDPDIIYITRESKDTSHPLRNVHSHGCGRRSNLGNK